MFYVIRAHAYTTQSVGKDATFNFGYVRMKITDQEGLSSTVYIRMYSPSPPSITNMAKYSSTWDCYLATPAQGFTYLNLHNIVLNQTKVTTQKDQNGNYNILNFSISYDQHAGCAYAQCNTDTYQRLNFNRYSPSGTQGTDTIPRGVVNVDTKRTVNLMTTATNCGLVTYGKKRYLDCSVEIVYKREKMPPYIIHYEGNGGIGTMEEQEVEYDEITLLKSNEYQRDGFEFCGWSGKEHDPSIRKAEQEEVRFSINESEILGFEKEEQEQIKRENRLILYAVWKPKEPFYLGEEVEEDTDMFLNCEQLEGGMGSDYSKDHTGIEMAHIDETDNPGYFTDRFSQ